MIVFGIHPVLEALESTEVDVDGIWITKGKSGKRLQEIIDQARSRGIPLHFEVDAALSRKAASRQHQDVVAEVSPIVYASLEGLLEGRPSRLLLFDSVEDPRNLGGVLRTAEALGVGGVLLPRRGSCGITPTVIKTSAGAALHMKICRVRNVVQAMDHLKKQGYWMVGLDLSGEEGFDQVDTRLPLAVVVGGEQKGLRRLVRERCDYLVRIPMVGRVASLNLSVAAAVLLYSLENKPVP